MKLHCWYCHKSVSSELQEGSLFRAIAVCPDCIGKSSESEEHPLFLQQRAETAEKLLADIARELDTSIQAIIENIRELKEDGKLCESCPVDLLSEDE